MPLRPNHSLIHALKTGTLLIAATVATSLCAQAGQDDVSKERNKNVIEQAPRDPRFYLELGAAGEFDYHATKFISNGSADFGVVGAFALPAKIQSRTFGATHDIAAISGRLNFGYIVNPVLTVYGGFMYTHSDGDDSRRLGYVTDAGGAFGPAGSRYDLFADVGQYQAFTGLAGAKITLPRTILDFIHAPKFIIPNFSLAVGGRYVQEQHARFFTTGAAPVNSTLNLYDDSLVFTVQGGFGYELRVARNFSLNVDTHYGYDTKPDRDDRTLNGPNNSGFNGINKSGDRFYQSVGLSAVYKF